jgi:hypothetical protein
MRSGFDAGRCDRKHIPRESETIRIPREKRFPAMLRFRRLSAVTAMMAMTMPITIQRTCVGLAASTVPLDALRCSSKRFFISERLHFPHDSLG